MPIQTLISSSSFINIPIPIISIAVLPHFVSKINLASLKKFKLVSPFSQPGEITGVFYTLALFANRKVLSGRKFCLRLH